MEFECANDENFFSQKNVSSEKPKPVLLNALCGSLPFDSFVNDEEADGMHGARDCNGLSSTTALDPLDGHRASQWKPVESSSSPSIPLSVDSCFSPTWGAPYNTPTTFGRYILSLKRQRLESVYLSGLYYVLLYAIPQRNRNGQPNNLWQACSIIYCATSPESTEWKERATEYLGEDDACGDKVFRAVVPRPKSSSAVKFFIKDIYSDERDHPRGVCGPEESNLSLNGNYYNFASPLMSLRDGESAEGDRISTIGITICFVATSQPSSIHSRHSLDSAFETWNNSALHYLDPLDALWKDKNFSTKTICTESILSTCSDVLSEVYEEFRYIGVVNHLTYRSLLFVIRNNQGTRWLNPVTSTFSNFHAFFPGIYVVTTSGELFDLTTARNTSQMIPKANNTSDIDCAGDSAWRSNQHPHPRPRVFEIGTPLASPRYSVCSLEREGSVQSPPQ